MSIHSDAVFNRCHPARRWSGSSSASRRRQATTPCSKAYRQSRTRLSRLTPFLAGAVLFFPAALASQNSSPAAAKNPEVVNLTLKGVKVVRKDELTTNIYTTASYCNSFILKPFCWISKSKNFYTRKYLDHKDSSATSCASAFSTGSADTATPKWTRRRAKGAIRWASPSQAMKDPRWSTTSRQSPTQTLLYKESSIAGRAGRECPLI